MRDFMPKGLLGMLLASFCCIHVDNVDSIKLGASYLINDLYLRFIRPSSPKRNTLIMSWLVTLILAFIGLLVTSIMNSIAEYGSLLWNAGQTV